jgi:hypothetical protein
MKDHNSIDVNHVTPTKKKKQQWKWKFEIAFLFKTGH